ncbi:hypothetical protein BD779DRAFT_1072504 [Infundibulicybe gibba]|nr:hypothetical protein BD779DRAFT_1072504 [Infundibulicybe gibba]
MRDTHLDGPSLYIRNLPSSISEEEVTATLMPFSIKRAEIRPHIKMARLEFGAIAEAERALATLHLRYVFKSEPDVPLELTPSPDALPFQTMVSGHPRLAMGLEKDAEPDVYATLRPFGPIAYLRCDESDGAIVHFWTEKEAQQAERALKDARITNSKGRRVKLCAYDPRSLFCTNLHHNVTSEQLRSKFETFGVVTSARIVHTTQGRSRGFGFVRFSQAAEASAAKKNMDGAYWMSRSMSIMFEELRGHSREPGWTLEDSWASRKTSDAVPTSDDNHRDDRGSIRSSSIDDSTMEMSDISMTSQKTPTLGVVDPFRGQVKMECVEEPCIPPAPAELECLRARVAELEQNQATLQQKHEAEIQELKAQVQEQAEEHIRVLKEEHHSEIDQLETQNQGQLEQLKFLLAEEYRSEIEKLEKHNQDRITQVKSELSEEHRSEVGELEKHNQDQITWVKSELAEEHRSEIERLERHNQARITQVKSELAGEYQSRIQTMEARQEALERKIMEVRKALGRSRYETELAQTESQEWERKFKVADARRKILELEADQMETGILTPMGGSEQKRKESEEPEAEVAHQAKKRKISPEVLLFPQDDLVKTQQANANMEEQKPREAELEEAKRIEAEEVRRIEVEEARRIEAEEARRIEEEEQKAREAKLEAEKRMKAWEEAHAKEVRRCRDNDRELWGSGAWTTVRAIRRFEDGCEDFLDLEVSESKPLTFGIIPWPTVMDPLKLKISDIDRTSIEDFFDAVEDKFTTRTYDSILRTASSVFRQDEWQSRKLLDTVLDPTLRESIDDARAIASETISRLRDKL